MAENLVFHGICFLYYSERYLGSFETYTAQKMKFSITDFFSKCDQIRSFLRIWLHLLKKSVMKNSIFCLVIYDFLHSFSQK